MKYLDKKIRLVKQTELPWAACSTSGGYTNKRGGPTRYMIQLQYEKIWRRVYVWQFSNASTMFVRIKGTEYIIADWVLKYHFPNKPGEEKLTECCNAMPTYDEHGTLYCKACYEKI